MWRPPQVAALAPPIYRNTLTTYIVLVIGLPSLGIIGIWSLIARVTINGESNYMSKHAIVYSMVNSLSPLSLSLVYVCVCVCMS